MDDAAVVAALVLTHAIFFLEQEESKAGESLRDLKGDGEADDASTDDDNIVAGIGHQDGRATLASCARLDYEFTILRVHDQGHGGGLMSEGS